MKTLFTSLFLLIGLSYGLPQQIDLTGQISIHNSRYRTGEIEYVADAFVSAPFAGSTNSDSEGLFGLTFQGIESGTVIKLAAEKAGLEVVNTYDLERVVLGQKSKLPVYLAPKGRLAEAQTELYNISKTALFARRDALIARLRGEKAESDAALAELERDWGIELGNIGEAMELLDSKIAELEKRLPEFAQELAAKNLDFASELYIQAYELYQAGDIVGAISVLDDARLEQSYQEALASIEKGKSLEEVGRDLQEKGKLQIEQVIESYRLKVKGHNLLFAYREAAAAQQKIVDILEASTEDETLELANAYSFLGSTLHNLGEYTKAIAAKLKDAEIKEQILAGDDQELAISYNNLALIYLDLGDFAAALAAQQKAIAIQVQVLEPNHPHVATSYNNLASIFKGLGDFAAASATQQKAITIQEQVLEPNHLHIANSYNNLSTIYQELGDYQAALVAQQKDIAIIEQVLEPNHPNIAFSYSNLAIIHKELGDNETALAAQQKALAIQAQVLEPNHPSIATSYNNLASIYRNLGDYETALATQQKVLAIREQVLEPNHPSIATSYNNLALIYQDLKDYEAASAAQQKDIAIREQVLEPNHPSIGISYHNLAVTFYSLGQLDSAILYEEKAFSIWQVALPKDHPSLATVRSNFTILYPKRGAARRSAGQYQAAIADYQRALAFNDNQSDLLNQIGLTYYYAAQYEQALESYNAAYQRGGIKQWIHLNNTGIAYAKWGKLAEAKEHFTQLEALIPDQGLSYRNWGLYYTIKGEPDTALDNLEKAIQLGYDNWDWLRTEAALDPLRDHPRFKALLTQAPDKKE